MFMYSYCMFIYLIVPATLTEVSPCFSSVVRQMPRYNPQRRGTAHTLPKFLCYSMCFFLFCIILCIVCMYLYYCRRVATQLQLTNISSYHNTSYSRINKIVFEAWQGYLKLSSKIKNKIQVRDDVSASYSIFCCLYLPNENEGL